MLRLRLPLQGALTVRRGRQPTNVRALVRVQLGRKPGRVETRLQMRSVSSREERPPVQAAAIEGDNVPPFLEPLLRGLLLGASCGVLCEVLHVALKLAGLTAADGLIDVFGVIETQAAEFSPLFLWDHVAAIGSWLCFYMIESVAVLSILQQYPDDSSQAEKALDNVVTLPKKMLPVSLGALKRLVYYSLFKHPAVVEVSGLGQGMPSSSRGPAPPQALGFRSSGTAVLDRPVTVPDVDAVVRPRVAPTKPEKPIVKPEPARAPRSPLLKPGSWDPAVNPYAAREKELLERRSYLRNFWYAAALSENLAPGKLLKVDILGRTVVLFRDAEGRPHCLENACPHRGAPLSEGWMKQLDSGETTVVCPYHGWAFDCKGKLREVPSASCSTALPQRQLVDAYPLEEKGGFIWLFFGSKHLHADERPPIPWAKELDDPNWKPVYGEIEFDCGHWGVFENAIDMAHIHYLHGDSFGNSSKPTVEDMQVKRDTFDITATFSIHNKPVSPLWEFTAVDAVPVVAKAMLPSSSAITIQLGAGVSMITFVNTVPISADRAVNRFCLIRNFAGWDGFDAWARNAMYRILGEDKVMVEQLQPGKLRKEVSLAPDLPQIEFRKLRQEWVDMGYAIAPEMTESFKGSLDM